MDELFFPLTPPPGEPLDDALVKLEEWMEAEVTELCRTDDEDLLLVEGDGPAMEEFLWKKVNKSYRFVRVIC